MLYVILMGIIAFFVAVFALQNAMAVEVSFLFWHFSMSLALIILSCLLAGFFLASLWTLKVKAGHYMKDRRLKEQLRQLEDKKADWEERQERQARRPVPHMNLPRTERKGKAYDPARDQDPIIKPFRPKE